MKHSKRQFVGREVGEGMLPGSSLGNYIRKRRIALKISQRVLADRIGLTQSHISRIERGEDNLLFKYIPLIVKALRIRSGGKNALELLARKQRKFLCVLLPYTESETKMRCIRQFKNKMGSLNYHQAKKLETLFKEFSKPKKKK